MIFDAENMFFNKQALSASTIVSDSIYVGPGEAGDPLHLVLTVDKNAGSGTMEVELQTSADEAFSEPVTLGTFSNVPLSVKLPRGNKGYLRLKVTSTYTAGTMTSGLVCDDDIAY